MKVTIGFVMIIAGIAFGVYAGLWWAFIGGIIDVVNAIKAPDIVALDIAIGVAKIVFAPGIGAINGLVAILPGYALIKSA